eukprot:1893258-Rhodomonas_salina.1
MFSLTDKSLHSINKIARVNWLKTAMDNQMRGYMYKIVQPFFRQQEKRDTSGEWRPTEDEVVEISRKLFFATEVFYTMTQLKPVRPRISTMITIDPLLTCPEILQILSDRARWFKDLTTTVISVYHRREPVRMTQGIREAGEETRLEVIQYSFTLSNPNWPSAFRVDMQRSVSHPDTFILKFNKNLGDMYCPDDADYFEIL